MSACAVSNAASSASSKVFSTLVQVGSARAMISALTVATSGLAGESMAMTATRGIKDKL